MSKKVYTDARKQGLSELEAWQRATAKKKKFLDLNLFPAGDWARLSLNHSTVRLGMQLGGLLVIGENVIGEDDSDQVLGVSPTPDARGRHAVWVHRTDQDDDFDVRVAGVQPSGNVDPFLDEEGLQDEGWFVVPTAESLDAFVEHGLCDPSDLPLAAHFERNEDRYALAQPGRDPSWLGGRAMPIVQALCLTHTENTDHVVDGLRHGGGPAQFEQERARFAQEPHLVAYWLLRYALLVDDARLEETRRAAKESTHPLVVSALELAEEVRAWPPAKRFGDVAGRVHLAEVRTKVRAYEELGLPALSPEMAEVPTLSLATTLREHIGEAKPIIEKVLALDDGEAKREAIAAIFELAPARRNTGDKTFSGSLFQQALLYALSVRDPRFNASIAALIGVKPISNPTDILCQLVLVKLDRTLAQKTLSQAPQCWWGRLALEPNDAELRARAVDLFVPFEQLELIKPSAAEGIVDGAWALIATEDAALLRRVAPFVLGKKPAGPVATTRAQVMRSYLEAVGFGDTLR